MIVYDVQQNTPEWLEVRKGIPTASKAASILTSTELASTQRSGYIHELIAKRFDAYQSWGGNRSTKRGHELEPDAVAAYEFLTDLNCEPIGFVTNDAGTFGCSPDRMVGKNGGVQIKCCEGKEHVHMLLGNKLPSKHLPQVYSELWTTGRKWWDFFAYHPKLPSLRIRTYRTDAVYVNWIEMWEIELAEFTKKLESDFEKIANYHAK